LNEIEKKLKYKCDPESNLIQVDQPG